MMTVMGHTTLHAFLEGQQCVSSLRLVRYIGKIIGTVRPPCNVRVTAKKDVHDNVNTVHHIPPQFAEGNKGKGDVDFCTVLQWLS